MELCVCAVRDAAADAFMAPFCVPSVGVAKRSFQDAVNRVDTTNAMYAHPEHFELFQIGTFDEQSGRLVSMVPVSLGTALSMKITKED